MIEHSYKASQQFQIFCTVYSFYVCVCIFVCCLKKPDKKRTRMLAKGQECGKVDWFVKSGGGGGEPAGGGGIFLGVHGYTHQPSQWYSGRPTSETFCHQTIFRS